MAYLEQLAIAGTLCDDRVTSSLIGASSAERLEQRAAVLDRLDFSVEELSAVDRLA